MTGKSKELQDFYSSLEDYLRNTLVEEKLSAAAQIKRRHLLDQFYALNLQPFVKHKTTSAITVSSTNLEITKKPLSVQTENGTQRHSTFITDSSRTSATERIKKQEIKPSSTTGETRKGNYAEIVVQNGNGKHESSEIPLMDSECGDIEAATCDVENDTISDTNPSTDAFGPQHVLLPRTKSPPPAALLGNVIYVGYLHQKGLITWTKRYCVISDQRLLCFRSDRESKPIQLIPLTGCDIGMIEKDGKASLVLRICQTNGESHWFQAESKELAEAWKKNLIIAASTERSTTSTTVSAAAAASAALAAVPSDLRSDLDSSLSTISSTGLDTNTASGTSSEAGSGDGVVTSANQTANKDSNQQPVIDRRKKSRLGESLQTLLSSLSKKKSDRLKRAFLESGQLEPETHVAGYVNICSELAEGNKWVKRFCAVRFGRLDCYCDPLDEYIEFSILLAGAQVDFLNKKMKKEYAVQIVQDNREILLEAYNETDYSRWMKILMCETGCMSTQHVAQINSKTSERSNGETSEDIYDEVYNWQIYDELTDGSTAPAPPPLPKIFPPKCSSISSKSSTIETAPQDENDYLEPQPYDSMFDQPLGNDKDDSIDLETAVNTAFFSIRDGLSKKVAVTPARIVTPAARDKNVTNSSEKTVTPAGHRVVTAVKEKTVTAACDNRHKVVTAVRDRSSSLSPAALHREVRRGQPTTSVERARMNESPPGRPTRSISAASSDSESNVVKCHRGPTIEEDKELLESTRNPILQKILAERERRSVSNVIASALDEKISELKKSSEDLKKRRRDLEGSVTAGAGLNQKIEVSKQMETLNKQIQSIDVEIGKLSILINQREASVTTDKSNCHSATTSSRSSITSLESHRTSTSSLSQMGNIQSTFLRLSQESSSVRGTSQKSSVHRSGPSIDPTVSFPSHHRHRLSSQEKLQMQLQTGVRSFWRIFL